MALVVLLPRRKPARAVLHRIRQEHGEVGVDVLLDHVVHGRFHVRAAADHIRNRLNVRHHRVGARHAVGINLRVPRQDRHVLKPLHEEAHEHRAHRRVGEDGRIADARRHGAGDVRRNHPPLARERAPVVGGGVLVHHVGETVQRPLALGGHLPRHGQIRRVEAEREHLRLLEHLHVHLRLEQLRGQHALAQELREVLHEAHHGRTLRDDRPERLVELAVVGRERVDVQVARIEDPCRGREIARLDRRHEVAVGGEIGILGVRLLKLLRGVALHVRIGVEDVGVDRIFALEARETNGVRNLLAVLLRVVGVRVGRDPVRDGGLEGTPEAAHRLRDLDEVHEVVAGEDDLLEGILEEMRVLLGEIDKPQDREGADETLVAPAHDRGGERLRVRPLKERNGVLRGLLRARVEGIAKRARHRQLLQERGVRRRPGRNVLGVGRVCGGVGCHRPQVLFQRLHSLFSVSLQEADCPFVDCVMRNKGRLATTVLGTRCGNRTRLNQS